MEDENQSVTPEKVIQILKEHNIIVSYEQAKNLLYIIDELCKLAVNQYVNI